jgi:hypothetical protein
MKAKTQALFIAIICIFLPFVSLARSSLFLYSFDQDTGSIIQDDSKKYNGIVFGGANIIKNDNHRELSFDGVDDFLEVSGSQNLSLSDFTISSWLSLSDISGIKNI